LWLTSVDAVPIAVVSRSGSIVSTFWLRVSTLVIVTTMPATLTVPIAAVPLLVSRLIAWSSVIVDQL